ncbi:uncharacterized protein OCT59_019535 [Rhizophagus irregularis]|uniref:Uncharacterized protein n=1 Tax=Rhizophagus irregularis (strain DAOM 181602 / DAOM 197198 / MUCL 43194) TaxID=747089 RepID=U9TDH5_RHIID|nr:hypothetical protein OCT59_019535 [Rhizophagus irregularis]
MEFDYKSPYQPKLDRYTEFDSLKVLVGWCYDHAIRAVCHHIRSKKFTIEEDDSREILAKFAMRVWNSVRIKENIDEIEN